MAVDSLFNTSEYSYYFDNDNPGNGVLNMKRCTNGSIFLSQPHFLNAHVQFLNDVDGLKPIESKHDFIFRLEPVIIL